MVGCVPVTWSQTVPSCLRSIDTVTGRHSCWIIWASTLRWRFAVHVIVCAGTPFCLWLCVGARVLLRQTVEPRSSDDSDVTTSRHLSPQTRSLCNGILHLAFVVGLKSKDILSTLMDGKACKCWMDVFSSPKWKSTRLVHSGHLIRVKLLQVVQFPITVRSKVDWLDGMFWSAVLSIDQDSWLHMYPNGQCGQCWNMCHMITAWSVWWKIIRLVLFISSYCQWLLLAYTLSLIRCFVSLTEVVLFILNFLFVVFHI